MLSKQPLMSPSRTHCGESLRARLMKHLASASAADLFGRNPKELPSAVISAIGSSASRWSACIARSFIVGTVASYCISYSDILGSGSYAIRVGNSLSQCLFDFWRERHAQAASRGAAYGNLSLTDPGVERVRCDPETGCDLFHTQLARSEQLWPVDVVGVTHPLD